MTLPGSAIDIADRLHAAGTQLLSGGLDAFLNEYGTVCYTGSYFLDLLAWPDLDIYLPLEPSPGYRARFLAMGARLDSACALVSLRFLDCLRYPVETLPEGLYWGVQVQQNASLRWKLDIWALPPAVIEAKQAELSRLKRKLTPEKRALILSFKQALMLSEGRTPVQSGYSIYCAVLDHDLRTLEAVQDYLRGQGVDF